MGDDSRNKLQAAHNGSKPLWSKTAGLWRVRAGFRLIKAITYLANRAELEP